MKELQEKRHNFLSGNYQEKKRRSRSRSPPQDKNLLISRSELDMIRQQHLGVAGSNRRVDQPKVVRTTDKTKQEFKDTWDEGEDTAANSLRTKNVSLLFGKGSLGGIESATGRMDTAMRNFMQKTTPSSQLAKTDGNDLSAKDWR